VKKIENFHCRYRLDSIVQQWSMMPWHIIAICVSRVVDHALTLASRMYDSTSRTDVQMNVCVLVTQLIKYCYSYGCGRKSVTFYRLVFSYMCLIKKLKYGQKFRRSYTTFEYQSSKCQFPNYTFQRNTEKNDAKEQRPKPNRIFESLIRLNSFRFGLC
jgi:hypothetical protein